MGATDQFVEVGAVGQVAGHHFAVFVLIKSAQSSTFHTAHRRPTQSAFAHRNIVKVGHFVLVNHGKGAYLLTIGADVSNDPARFFATFGSAKYDHRRLD